ARREAREGLRGFRIFTAALILGVFAVAAVGSLSQAFLAGLEREQRRLLDGDFEITAVDATLSEEMHAWLESAGKTSDIIGAQVMVRLQSNPDRRSVIQLKAVDDAYPMVGTIETDKGLTRDALFAARTDNSIRDPQTGATKVGATIWGAIADPDLFDRLGVEPGTLITIGAATFELRDRLAEEPDRASAGFLISPRLMISADGAQATGLIARSGLVRRSTRVVLNDETKRVPAVFKGEFAAAFPDNGLRVRSASDAANGLGRTLSSLEVFLTMVGLSALIIGGVGAANAVHAYMQQKLPVIATLKCLGATGGFIMKTYVVQIVIVAAIAVLVGVVLGALTPFAVVGLVGGLLPFEAETAIYPLALARAAMFGLLAALIFALLPLAKARQTRPAQLFRALVESDRERPSRQDLGVIAGLSVLFVTLAVLFSKDIRFAIGFAIGGVVVYGLLRLAAYGLIRLGRRYWKPAGPIARLAAASLTRPGAVSASVVVSIGLGLTLLAMISLIDANLSREVRSAVPDKAPQLFFSDIKFDERSAFEEGLAQIAPDASLETYYMLRSGVKYLNGQPLSAVEGAEDTGWARENDWGVTSLAYIPETLGTIVEGSRWPTDYTGPPLISLSAWQAGQFGLSVGDSITLTIAGRAVTATIASLHDVDWNRNGINFIAVFAPGTLEAARPTAIGSLRFSPERLARSAADKTAYEETVTRKIAEQFPDVGMIRTRQVTASIAEIIDNIGLVIRSLSAVTILAGLIVLLGAVAADFRRKLKDAMIMKAMGASRERILRAFALEYGILGFVPAVAALGLGALASWFVVVQRMELGWTLSPAVLIGIVGGATAVTLTIGLIAAGQALKTRPWPVLRSD
ncbi:MAG: FtsX-like permease family protein, partial [Pseudomonadota bacterium]